jgi:DNA invertase Pin-like site-specific DNA recombinase
MKRVAAYERLSVADLPDERGVSSLQRQRDTIDHWAMQNGTPVSQYFRDSAGRRHQASDPKRRPDYTRLIAEIRAGKWDILVIEELTRLGFENHWDLMDVCSFLRKNHVELIEGKSGRVINGDSVSDGIMSLVGGHASAKEVEQIASRSLGNKMAQARAGIHLGGKVPYGLMQECRWVDGSVRWTLEEAPDGRKIHEYPDGTVLWQPDGYLPSRLKGEVLVLVPSKRYPERAGFVKLAADMFLSERISFGGIAKRLNDLGAYPPGGVPWYSAKVQSLLLMSGGSYTGYATFGKRLEGRLIQVGPAMPQPAGKNGIKKPQDWIWSSTPTFDPPIICKDDFLAIVAKADAEKNLPRRGKNQDLILSGLIYCQCGVRMAGSAKQRKNSDSIKLLYMCSQNLKYHGHPPSGCAAHQVPQDVILTHIERWLEETGIMLDGATTTSQEALLEAIYSEQQHAREGLREAREAAERWLAEALLAVCEPTILADGRQRYRLDPYDTKWEITLPGCRDHANFLDALGWVSAGTKARDRERLAELQQGHDRLFQALLVMPTEMMREKCLVEVRRVEAEISDLRAGSGVADRLRSLTMELAETAKRISVARKSGAKGDLSRRGKAISDVIERIELSFRREPRAVGSKQVVSRLDSVRIVPRGCSSDSNSRAATC